MRRKICVILTALALTVSCAGTALAAVNAAADSRSGVVRVLSLYEAYLEGQLLGQVTAVGSAFGVGRAGQETDVFVTNRHVIEDRTEVLEAEGQSFRLEYHLLRSYLLKDDYAYSDATGLDTSRVVPCSIIYQAREDEPDLAVLRAAEPLEGRQALPLAPAESGGVEVGDTVYALGYPYSADAATTDDYNNTDYAGSVESVTITTGVVSRFVDYTQANARIIQHDAAINGGNSGGPLINDKGAVVGVNTITFNMDGVSSAGSTNHSGSVASEHVMRVLDGLGIQYDVRKSGPSPLLIGGIAAAAIAAIAVVALVLRKKKGKAVPASGAAGNLRLQGVSGSFSGRRFPISGQVRIGRDPARNDLVYPQNTPGVSGAHCVLKAENGQLWLTDLGSSHGTFLAGGQRLTPNQPVRLQPGDRFCLGSDKEMFQIGVKGGA